MKAAIRGSVQGVGFRPFIHRLATELGLAGWVRNTGGGVEVEVEGGKAALEDFLLRLEIEKPPRSSIHGLESSWLDSAGFSQFEILASEENGERTAIVPPDIATCQECIRDVFDPENRRHLYPFANCTNCGPRFSIIEALPYDRSRTSMKRFPLCSECSAEFNDVRDRRFHAQPIACPACGPQLEFWNPEGQMLDRGHAALLAAARTIREGGIVAVKGLGGFQLLTRADSTVAALRLRELKHREEKPFAIMFRSITEVRADCELTPLEERLIRSPEAPIVLVRRAGRSALPKEIAPRNPCLGAMLPCTPLHHLLMEELGFPVIATSGNLSDEPLCIDEHEAVRRLGPIADALLVHDRPILRPVDDSVVRVVLGRELMLRRARGYAPLPVRLGAGSDAPSILALGGHLKSTVALAIGSQVFLSQHLGNLETVEACESFTRSATDLPNLFAARPSIICHDSHPDYRSTQYATARLAEDGTLQGISVQHHTAHILACMAENELAPPILGVAWDGTGYGPDGTIWGGEFLLVEKASVKRIAHLRRFPLPGGEKAVKEPRRVALSLLREVFGDSFLASEPWLNELGIGGSERAGFQAMLRARINCPLTSSMGRLFDGVAALARFRQSASFEGQAAMEMEFAADGIETNEAYAFEIRREFEPAIVDWQPLIEEVLSDAKHGLPPGLISAKFHNALADCIVGVARLAGLPQVALSGGCFQNRCLTERAVLQLEQGGFRAYWHQRIPPNDGGIALGQIIAALRHRP